MTATELPPRIVVTDGHTLNPGDLSWSGLESLAELTVYERSTQDQVVARCQGATMVLTNKVVLDKAVIEQLPHLRYIGVLATGYNVVDLQAAREHGIVVTNIPAYGPGSVAQFVFSLLLQLVQPVDYYRDQVRQDRWAKSPDFCFYDHSMSALETMTLGIVGYGAIGRRVAQIALGFGMKVLLHSRTRPADLPDAIAFVALEDLARQSDVVSLHCPLTDRNMGFVDAEFLEAMKSSAYLINTARGPLINEQDLAAALQNGEIAGAALDVLAVEPPEPGHPLVTLPNCIVTPHIAWSTQAARQRLMDIALENVSQFLEGKPQNIVN